MMVPSERGCAEGQNVEPITRNDERMPLKLSQLKNGEMICSLTTRMGLRIGCLHFRLGRRREQAFQPLDQLRSLLLNFRRSFAQLLHDPVVCNCGHVLVGLVTLLPTDLSQATTVEDVCRCLNYSLVVSTAPHDIDNRLDRLDHVALKKL